MKIKRKSLHKFLLAFFLLAYTSLYAGNENSIVIPLRHYDESSSFFKVNADGKSLAAAQYKDFHYTYFQQKGSLRFTVQCAEEIQSFTISPLSKKIEGKLIGKNTIEFILPQPSYTVVTVNGKTRLFLFGEDLAEKPSSAISILDYKVDTTGKSLNTSVIQKAINEAASKKKTLFFPEGIYKTGRLTIPSNSRIYLAPGALLKASDDLTDLEAPNQQKPRGFVNIIKAENVEIYGLGVIDGNGRNLREKFGDAARIRLMFVSGSKNISIKGITERDPGSWNTQIMYSERVTFKNVKQLNDADLSNTDGFDPDASSFITIENCFGYCGDDNVAIKVTQQNGARNKVSDIIVRGNVFLTRKSSLKVGTESRGESFSNIVFENNDVVMSDRGMALYCSDGATYENISYINNRFEENYSDAKKSEFYFQINKRNADSKIGIMKNILIKDCSFMKPFPNHSTVEGFDAEHPVELTIENLMIGGKQIRNASEGGIKTNSFSRIVFK